MEPEDPNKQDDPNDANKIKNEGLKFVFLQNRDNFPTNPCPYYDDGNPDMYTDANVGNRN